MLCEICHKNDATIHMQEILNGTKKTLNICSECASQHKITGSDLDGLNLAEILYNLSSQMLSSPKGDGEGAPHPNIQQPDDNSWLYCECGWNTGKFRNT